MKHSVAVFPLQSGNNLATQLVRQDLHSTVRIVQQLSITHDEALALFRQMLKAEEE